MVLNINDIEAWASDELGDNPAPGERARDLGGLVSQIERDRRLPQPSSLPPGSPERQVAEGRQQRIRQAALSLGYQPPVREAAMELATHGAIEAAPISEAAKPAAEMASEGEDGVRQRKKRRQDQEQEQDSGREIGFG